MCSAPHPRKDPGSLHLCCSPAREGRHEVVRGDKPAVPRQSTLAPHSHSFRCPLCRVAFVPVQFAGLFRATHPTQKCKDKRSGGPDVRWVAETHWECTLNHRFSDISQHLCESLIPFSDIFRRSLIQGDTGTLKLAAPLMGPAPHTVSQLRQRVSLVSVPWKIS